MDKTPDAGLDKSKLYVIGPLDVLYISVWNTPNLTGPVDVGPDGMISMQLIGQIKVDGLTQSDLIRAIRSRLASSVFECAPEVNVQVARINSKKFSVLGGVFRQGEFPLLGEMTVMDALANCGGFKDFANTKKITISRGNQIFRFNYKDVSHNRNMEQNIKLQNGDRIFVPE